jgi:hypothetical protein
MAFMGASGGSLLGKMKEGRFAEFGRIVLG